MKRRRALVIHNTSGYDTTVVRALVRFAMGARDLGRTFVRVTHCARGFRGLAQAEHREARAFGCRYHVLVRIGVPAYFPVTVQYPGLSTAPRYTMESWQEALVCVAAHEFTHIVQFRTRAPVSEIEAEHSSLVTLERFRREGAGVLVDLVPGVSDAGRKVLCELVHYGVTSADVRTAEVLAREGLVAVVAPHPFNSRRVFVRPAMTQPPATPNA